MIALTNHVEFLITAAVLYPARAWHTGFNCACVVGLTAIAIHGMKTVVDKNIKGQMMLIIQ